MSLRKEVFKSNGLESEIRVVDYRGLEEGCDSIFILQENLGFGAHEEPEVFGYFSSVEKALEYVSKYYRLGERWDGRVCYYPNEKPYEDTNISVVKGVVTSSMELQEVSLDKGLRKLIDGH